MPRLLVTMGDPAGIGPEIAAKALIDPRVGEVARPVLVGDAPLMERTLLALGLGAKVRRLDGPEDGPWDPGVIRVWHVPSGADLETLRPGEIQAQAGRAAFAYVENAITAVLAGKSDGLVTGPIHKEALRAAGVPYIGHTEMLGELTGSPSPMTMFEVDGLRIFFLTRHVALADAIRSLTPESVLEGIRGSFAGLRELGVRTPSLAVAGLNPHAGEGGLFGDEEQRALAPAITAARAEGYDVHGPVPADAVFHQAHQGKYDAALALYHDQGHIAAKMLDFERTVSVTLGIPILRTSVDHGTAFDIAGKGVASAVSLIEAFKVGARYSATMKPGI